MEDTKKTEDGTATVAVDNDTQDTIDPVKKELEKVKAKGAGRSELEKALFSRQQIDKRIVELQGDNAPVIDEDDNAQVTVGMLKERDKQQSTKTALDLAEGIESDSERELVKHHLANTIKPSGNAQEDLRHARSLVNSVKNGQIAEELARKGTMSKGSSAGAPPKKPDDVFEPTAEELSFMRPPFNLTKEDLIKARTQQK